MTGLFLYWAWPGGVLIQAICSNVLARVDVDVGGE